MSDSALQFDAATHTYTLHGVRVPSVTTVIKEVLHPNEYAGVSTQVLQHAADRGHAVERMIQLDLADELDVASLHPELLPYWHAWKPFPDRIMWRAAAPAWHMRVANEARGYAGTLDVLLKELDLLIDVKATVQLPRTVGVQTAAYADAIPDGATLKRACLHVTRDGCRLIPLTNRSDSADFLAALRVYYWRMRNDA